MAKTGRPRINIPVGSVWGKLTVIGEPERNSRGDLTYPCLCSCGLTCKVTSAPLRSGDTKSCGCIRKQVTARLKFKHGAARIGSVTAEFSIWLGMIDRCHNERNHSYDRYGGRGITVCDRWRQSFENFRSDMGPRPSVSHSIDRWPNNDGPYEPSNCRWATDEQQRRNTRRTRWLEVNGRMVTAVDFAEENGIPYKTLIGRLNRGISPLAAI